MRSCLPVETVSVIVYCYSALLAMEKVLKMGCIPSKKDGAQQAMSQGESARAVGIEEWKPNVICSIIQRTNNEKH